MVRLAPQDPKNLRRGRPHWLLSAIPLSRCAASLRLARSNGHALTVERWCLKVFRSLPRSRRCRVVQGRRAKLPVALANVNSVCENEEVLLALAHAEHEPASVDELRAVDGSGGDPPPGAAHGHAPLAGEPPPGAPPPRPAAPRPPPAPGAAAGARGWGGPGAPAGGGGGRGGRAPPRPPPPPPAGAPSPRPCPGAPAGGGRPRCPPKWKAPAWALHPPV